MTETSGRLQDLRDFTVQIRNPNTNAIVGTGIVVSNDGLIVTCVHVVQAALEVKRRAQAGDTVGVYFAQARGGEVKERRATVQLTFPEHDDDVALLKLVDGPPPLGPEQIAVLGSAEESEGHEFRSYGYQRLEEYLVGRAEGKILGRVEPPPSRNVQADPVQLQSNQINRGMSGAAVLDTTRNLVVGLVSETWWPDKSQKNSETAWAVDACVLTFDPLNFPLRDTPLPLRPPRQPPPEIVDEFREKVAPQLGSVFYDAPEPLADWIGREDLLAAMDADWREERVRVLGLIGFGGEGKSSLARKWLEHVLTSAEGPGRGPDGVLWWSFHSQPSVDAFLEAALKFLSAGRLDLREYVGANLRVRAILAMLSTLGAQKKRVIFVLDGLEMMQVVEGDAYGSIESNDLRDFLELFAEIEHLSCCVVTSRLPLLDLLRYPSYRHRDVERLSAKDGRALLQQLGVKGQDEALDTVVREWDGHALTLHLLGNYLTEMHEGEVTEATGLLADAGATLYERTHHMLGYYDEILVMVERDFLMLLSIFHGPTPEAVVAEVIRGRTYPGALNARVVVLGQDKFELLLKRLKAWRLLRYEAREQRYTLHPLIHAYYSNRLKREYPSQLQDMLEDLANYYRALVQEKSQVLTLTDVQPQIELIHWYCRAKNYDAAFDSYRQHLGEKTGWLLNHKLGAYETDLALMLEFFPDGDTSQELLVSDLGAKRFILNEVGFCLMNLGRLGEAAPFYERGNGMDASMEASRNASRGYLNLAELHAHLGALAASADAAGEALTLARRAQNKRDESTSLAYQAWADHLRGDMKTAGAAFAQAEMLEREIDSSEKYLYATKGIQHANHLRHTGDPAYARRVTEANLESCERNRWAFLVSQCHRVLGDLDAESNQPGSAREHYNAALKIARGISHRAVLIEALLGRGRFLARFVKDAASARSDLEEALGYATQGGYRIYEADIRNALAWMHLAAGDTNSAYTEAERARQMSEAMGYHWGVVDAAEVMEALSGGTAENAE
jgi:tetratricopeptide (TPR) repeat protein